MVYVLKNEINNQIIEAYDTESSALAQKANLIKTGEYRRVAIETLDVKSDFVTALSVVRIEGYMTANGPKVKLYAYNPSTTIEDSLTFNVSSRLISFTGYINLTADEQASSDVLALTQRINAYVEAQLAERIMNDNPTEPTPEPTPEPDPEPTPDPEPNGDNP